MTESPCHSPSCSGQRRRFRLRAVALGLLVTLFAVACGSGFDSVQSSSDTSDAGDDSSFDERASLDVMTAPEAEAGIAFEADAEAPADFDGRGDIAANQASSTGAAGVESTSQLPDLGRDIIFTATLEIASTDVSTATRDAIRAIEGRGGFLFSQETRGGSGGSSVLTFKVLPDQFQAALNDLGSVGDVRAQSISADDVSAVVVDLESRINTAEASVDRLRKLLDEANELQTIATLENQLLQRETTLEQLRGQLRTVRSQVDLATITVFVSELLNRPGINIDVTSFAGHDAGFSCFDGQSTRSGEVGDPITVCYRLTNTGDTPLVDVMLDDPALGATIGSLVQVDGDVTQIDPGETVVLAHEIELVEPVRVRTSVTATGIDVDGNPIEDEVRATAGTVRFDVTNVDDGFPSFGEVLSNSLGALVTLGIVIALIAVAVAPFMAVALVLGVPAWRLYRRNRTPRSERPTKPTPPAPPTTDDESAGPDPRTVEEATTTA